MKFWLCLCILLSCLLIPQFAVAQDAYLAWFTGATIDSSSVLPTPSGAPTLTSGGTVGNCLNLPTTAVGIDATTPLNAITTNKNGIISFWLCPKANGKLASGGASHKLILIGNTTTNGLQIEWDNAFGVIRFIMVGKNGAATKKTVLRGDISKWVANDWHHVQVAWIKGNFDDTPIGLAMWFDRVCVASIAFGGTAFMDPSTTDKKIYVGGDTTQSAYMDELIMRISTTTYGANTSTGGTPIVYRDYFRTGPYTGITLTNKPQYIKSDTRAVVGYKKQFGVFGTRKTNFSGSTTVSERITNFDDPDNWGAFDARDYITWSSSATSKATVDSMGLVTGVATGSTNITATFRGMTSPAYALTVVANNLADLGVMYVEQKSTASGTDWNGKYNRRNSFTGNNGGKIWPAAGEAMQTVVHYGNFGFTAANNFRVLFELIQDANDNYILDSTETTISSSQYVDVTSALAAGATTGTATFNWTWPAAGAHMYFVRVTLDSNSAVSEICEANNQSIGNCKARASHWQYDATQFTTDYTNKVMNLVGSFSDYDWCNAHQEKLGLIMHDAIYDSTNATYGILDAVRVDSYFATDASPNYYDVDDYFDGGFDYIWGYSGDPVADRMHLSGGTIHEMGHTTLGSQDVYGMANWVQTLLARKTSDGTYYRDSPNNVIYPTVGTIEDNAIWPSCCFDNQDEIGTGYSPLQSIGSSHMWLDSYHAGLNQKYRQTRQQNWYYCDQYNIFGTLMPTTNQIKFFDQSDNALSNAAVYVYQVVNTGFNISSNKYYPDRWKFFGTTNASGVFTFPTTTSTYWDDPSPSGQDGTRTVTGPFEHYSDYWGAYVKADACGYCGGECFLLRIVGANGEEFHLLPFSEFCKAYFANKANPAYSFRTNLTSNTSAPTQATPRTTTAATGLPTIKVKYGSTTYTSDFSITVTHGSPFSLDASVSTSSPTGHALQFFWDSAFNPYDLNHKQHGSTWTYTPPDPGTYSVVVYTVDSAAHSGLLTITVNVN